MGELTAIGFRPGQSLLHRLDPRTKQALLMGLGAVSMVGGWVYLALLSFIVIILIRGAGLRIGRVVREIRYFFLFLLFVFAVRTLAFQGGWIPAFAAGSAAKALMVCLRLLLMVVMGLLLIATTRIAYIRAALIWFLKPLPFVNESMAATMVGLVVRYLPLILFQGGEIADAQRARGIDRRRNPLTRLMRFTIVWFRRVFLSADELVAAMQARCYNEQRTLPELSFSQRDSMAVAFAIFLSLTVLLP
jgi:energy-coupling factor transporter transmembrane protein EcfT